MAQAALIGLLEVQGLTLANPLLISTIVLPEGPWVQETKNIQTPLDTQVAKSTQSALDTPVSKSTASNDWVDDPKNTEF